MPLFINTREDGGKSRVKDIMESMGLKKEEGRTGQGRVEE